MFKRIISLIAAVSILFSLAAGVTANESSVTVTLNGKTLSFYHQPRSVEGEIMLPAKELMEKFGFSIVWDDIGNYDGPAQTYTGPGGGYSGMVNGVIMTVKKESFIQYYDFVNLENDVKSISLEGDELVPLQFIEKIYGLKTERTGNNVAFSLTYVQQKPELTKKAKVLDVVKEFETLKDEIGYETVISMDHVKEDGVKNPEDAIFYPGDAPDSNTNVAGRVITVEDGKGFKDALEVQTINSTTVINQNVKKVSNRSDISTGDTVAISFWAKYTATAEENIGAQVRIRFQSVGDWAAFVSQQSELSKEWKRYVIPFKMSKTNLKNTAALCIEVGFRSQTIQIANMEVLNFKKNEAADRLFEDAQLVLPSGEEKGWEDGALWREEAFRRIEKYRKEDMNITVKNESSAPVEGAKINANMTRSEFMFGTMIQPLVFSNPGLRQFIVENFNSVSFENAWNATVDHGYNMYRWINKYKFASENNLYIRQHHMFWDSWNGGNWAGITGFSNFPKEEMAAILAPWFSKNSLQGAGLVDTVNIINEQGRNNPIVSKTGFKFFADVYEIPKNMTPAKLVFNYAAYGGHQSQWDTVKNALGILEELQALGTRLEGLGVEAHTGTTNTNMDVNKDYYQYLQTFYNQTDYLARSSETIEVTEYDYITESYTGADKKKILSMEAKALGDYLIATYSHPKAIGFQMWDYYSARHWRSSGALVDWGGVSKSEAMGYWRKYVLDEWKPKLKGVTDANGEYNVRSHRGEYDISVDVNGKKASTTLKVSKDGSNTVSVTVKKDGTLDITTSEPVVNQYEGMERYFGKELMNQHNDEAEYLKLADNMAVKATTEAGKNVDFILDNSENFWISGENDRAVVLTLEKPSNDFWISIDWHLGKDKKYLYSVDVSSDGETWTAVKSTESTELDKIEYIGKPVSYVRLSSITGAPIAPRQVRVLATNFFLEFPSLDPNK